MNLDAIQKVVDLFSYDNVKGFLAVLGLLSAPLSGLATCHWQDQIASERASGQAQVGNVAEAYNLRLLELLEKCHEEKATP